MESSNSILEEGTGLIRSLIRVLYKGIFAVFAHARQPYGSMK